MMTFEKCPTDDELRALSLGTLTEEQSDEILGHLPDCEACQAELATANFMEDTLVSHLRSPDADGDYRDEAECKIALAKALGSLASANSRSIDDSEIAMLLPKVLGDYEIVRPIGRGGMGTVYLARHTKLGRLVALKVLSSHRLLQPRIRQRFETEMRAVGQLSHPNIVTAHDARDVDELAVLVTEFIDGLDVGQILRRTAKVSVGNACEIARQTALALQYISDKGLVHRDIKPSNVMIGMPGNVKLLDLGLARLQLGDGERVDMTATGQAMGTADYVAPEQVNDSRHVDIRADIYALGCTIFKMLCGQPPFDDSRYPTAFAKMTAHVSDAPPSIETLTPDVPAELAEFVHRMMSKDVSDRPQTPAEVVEFLATFSDGADLKQLVAHAISAEEITSQPQHTANHAPLVTQPESKSFFRRRVPMFAAIAAGIIGILIGIVLGVVITIKHPDGTVSQVEAPDGASIKVSPEGDVEIDLAGGKQGKQDRPAERTSPLFADKDRLQGIWRAPDSSNGPGHIVVAFSDHNYLTIMNGEVVNAMSFGITSTSSFSTLVFNGPDSFKMQAVIQFDGDNKLSMQTEAGKMELQRIAHLPLTADGLKKIEENPETVLFSKTVQMIAEYQKTGELPISERVASLKFAAMQTRSRNNLKQIGLGLHNYLDKHLGVFPAAHSVKYVNDGNETIVARSWRVAILPFIGEQKLYDQFKLDEDWDSPHNIKLLNQMPVVYRAPTGTEDSTETPYLAIVGPQTVISEPAARMRDIGDGTSNTIMLVETGKTVPWTKPEDIAFDAGGDLPELLPIYEGGFHAAVADGSIKFIKSDTDKKDLRAYFTRDGLESIRIP